MLGWRSHCSENHFCFYFYFYFYFFLGVLVFLVFWILLEAVRAILEDHDLAQYLTWCLSKIYRPALATHFSRTSVPETRRFAARVTLQLRGVLAQRNCVTALQFLPHNVVELVADFDPGPWKRQTPKASPQEL